MPDLLLELFSEEIPARMQGRAGEDLKRLVTDGLVERGLTYEGARAYAGPRRLTLDLRGLATETPTRREERKGPRVDAPEKALEGFLRSTGLARDDLEKRADRKGEVWFATLVIPGRKAEEVIAEVVTEAVRGFPWPKSMRWGSGELRWVRPLHAILCLLVDEEGPRIVPFEIDGIAAGDATRGHRLSPGPIRPRSFEDYARKLEAAGVALDAEERKRRIQADAASLAFAQGLELVEDRGLLEEVTGLVERPVALMGEIGAEFLDLPPEVLQTSMKTHQKFFSVRNPATGRIERFVTIANVAAPDGGATILAGNRRVLAARLSDAKFFWENDLRVVKGRGMEGIAAMAAPLARVTFHNKLGSQAERVDRIATLARAIAPWVGAAPDLAERAARAAKADLASQMVYEFPELQGAMGRRYAEAAGLAPEVAAAAEAHYQPLGPSDAVPSAPVGVAVALADKLDMLTGFWAIDEKPTGSKDPFALRRAALGVIRILLENGLRLRLREAFNANTGLLDVAARHIGVESFGDHFKRHDDDLLAFFADRLKGHLRERGLRHDVIEACFRLGGQDDLVSLVRRVEALQAFLGSEDGANLVIGYRRAASIVAAEEKKDGNVEYSGEPDPRLAEAETERRLFDALDAAGPEIDRALEAEDYAGAMTALSRLRAPIDAFFDHVTVNAENAVLRRNRLCLLTRIRETMERVAIFSALEG